MGILGSGETETRRDTAGNAEYRMKGPGEELGNRVQTWTEATEEGVTRDPVPPAYFFF